MSNSQALYKIRHKKTQRWSKGGAYVTADGISSGSWVDNGGKIWDTLGKLRAHITSHLPKYAGDYCTDMSDWEVVEYRLDYQGAKGVHEIMDPKKLVALLTR